MLFVYLCNFSKMTILIDTVHGLTFLNAYNHGEKFIALLLMITAQAVI